MDKELLKNYKEIKIDIFDMEEETYTDQLSFYMPVQVTLTQEDLNYFNKFSLQLKDYSEIVNGKFLAEKIMDIAKNQYQNLYIKNFDIDNEEYKIYPMFSKEGIVDALNLYEYYERQTNDKEFENKLRKLIK